MKKFILLLVISVFTTVLSYAQWSDDPLVNTIVNNMSGSQATPIVSYDNAGNFYVGFFSNESGNYNVRLQYYSFAGIEQWATGGILVSSHTQNGSLTIWDLTTDNNGNCILVFRDIRTGNPDMYAYSISPSGNFLWGADGIALTNNINDEYLPSVTVNSSNDAIIAWQNPGSTYKEIVMQKITPTGNISWGANGIVFQSGSYSYTAPKLLAVESDNYIMAFYKETGTFPGITRHIYAQKFDATGAAIWTNDVVVSTTNGISPWAYNPTIASDGANGILVTWTDDRNSDNNIDAAVQRILSDGTTSWPANGSLVNTSTSNSNQNPQILGVNSNDETVVTWSKKNGSQSQTAIAGQKFSATGIQQWTTDGIEFIPMSADIGGTIGGVVYNGTNAMIAYDESVGGSSSHIKAIGIDNAGTLIWSPTTTFMAGRSTSKVHIVNSKLSANQMIAVWEDAGDDIYMQNIYTDGSMGDPPISTDATLSDLTVNNITVEGFSPAVFNYSVPIPTGDPLPVTGATPNFPAATVSINQAIAVPGSSSVIVTAEDGVTQLIYTINFYVAGTDATLTDLTIDGITVPGFGPSVFNYNYQVATGDPIPIIGATPADPLAMMTINQAIALPGAGTVVVMSEDGLTTNTYTVNFLYTPGTDATLSDLLVEGVTIDGFDPTILDYSYTVIYPNAAPYVQGISTDPLATIDDTQCVSIPGDAVLVVTAEDGVTTLTYTVSFSYLGWDATLSDLTVDGTTIPGYDPNTSNYQYVVPDITPIPVVDGTTSDPLATLTVTQATSIPGDATLLVVAADGVTQFTYTVHFYTLASDATLSDLTVDGTTIEDFDPLTTFYELDIPEGQPTPVIDGTPNDPLATTEITQAPAVPGEGTIIVTAQDGIAQMTYTVKFNLITGVDELELANITIYPNPVENILSISGYDGKLQTEIINLTGKVVQKDIIESTHAIEIDKLKSGVYFIVITDNNRNTKPIKFVKK